MKIDKDTFKQTTIESVLTTASEQEQRLLKNK